MSDAVTRLSAALADRYRIERELGQGGMATVYLATDLRHDRQVAIKLLHEDLGATLGPERFLAEIKTTAKLQHPHVLTLLDSGSTAEGQSGGLLYYVMPYVEGESLRDRLDREKQLPIDDAVRLASEIADALGAAHAHGIVHRDIKPENVLLQSGHALVADFGIALAVQHAGGSRLTQTGLSLGTPQYMAPEQAMGEKSVDARADIYALGAVTYEMLVGEPPFTGATVQAIVAKVLSSEAEPPTTIRKTIPPHVEDAVLTALAKLPADRFADVKAFVAALSGGQTSGARTQAARAGVRSAAERGRAWAVAGVTLGVFAGVAIGWLAWKGGRQGASAAGGGVSRSYLMQPRAEVLPAGTSDFVISPNGEDLVYVGPGDKPGTTQLWRKRRSELHAARINGTLGATAPFFSPDGKWVAYKVTTTLAKIPLDGGTAVTLGSGYGPLWIRGAWLADGRIVGGAPDIIGVMPSDGGKFDTLVGTTSIAGYNTHMVVALPGSKGIILQACTPNCSRSVLWTVDLGTKVTKRLLPDAFFPAYLPTGHLVYVGANGIMMAVPFDAAAMILTGTPTPVLENVASPITLSNSGQLIYREGALGKFSRPTWVDRSGKASTLDSSWVGAISGFALSPDGKRIAVSVVSEGVQQLWTRDADRGALSRLTFGAGSFFRPAWSADGRWVRFIHGDTVFAVEEKAPSTTGDPRPVPQGARQGVEVVESRDGAWIVMRTGGQGDPREILVLHRGVDSVARLVPSGPGGKFGIGLSPDARFISYMTDVSGRPEVYVSPFPDIAAARWQISLAGGTEAQWASNGHELFYVALGAIGQPSTLTAAQFTTTPTFAVTSRTPLFGLAGYQREGGFHQYEVAPGDQRFLMLAELAPSGDVVVVENWFSEIREKLKAKR